MVDIHSHFLPGLDDGAETFEQALAIIEMAAADGTTHLVGTPHCNDMFEFSAEKNRALLAELQGRVAGRITLLAGCDFHMSYENLERLKADRSPFTLNGGDYFLAELSDFGLPPNALELFHQLRLQGLLPVLTHPERNPLVLEKGAGWLQVLAGMGCAVQVTAGAFTGRFGRRAQRFAEELLERRLVHIVASDAHDTESRPPLLSPARTVVAEKFGAEVAEALFVENPRAAIESRALPYFPDPVEPPRRKRFWFF